MYCTVTVCILSATCAQHRQIARAVVHSARGGHQPPGEALGRAPAVDRATGRGVLPAGRPREGARAHRVPALRPQQHGGARLAGRLHQLHRVAHNAARRRDGRARHRSADQVRSPAVHLRSHASTATGSYLALILCRRAINPPTAAPVLLCHNHTARLAAAVRGLWTPSS